MEITIGAADRKSGMSMDEVEEAIRQAREAGMTVLVKTQMGFRGQILSMRFRKGIRGQIQTRVARA